jgi:hypothetical protein
MSSFLHWGKYCPDEEPHMRSSKERWLFSQQMVAHCLNATERRKTRRMEQGNLAKGYGQYRCHPGGTRMLLDSIASKGFGGYIGAKSEEREVAMRKE